MLSGSDIAVLPFTAGVTTKSSSLLTVLAHGLPTLVTRGDSAEPELEDGENCRVIPAVRDAGALAHALTRILDDPALQERLAAPGTRVIDGHAWPTAASARRPRSPTRRAGGTPSARSRRTAVPPAWPPSSRMPSPRPSPGSPASRDAGRQPGGVPAGVRRAATAASGWRSRRCRLRSPPCAPLLRRGPRRSRSPCRGARARPGRSPCRRPVAPR